MGSDGVSGAGESTSSRTVDPSWDRWIREHKPVVSLQTEHTVIAGIKLPSLSPALFQETPAIFWDLHGLQDPELDQAITAARVRLANNSGPSRTTDELNLHALETERAKRVAERTKQQEAPPPVPPVMADPSKYSVEELERQIIGANAQLAKQPFDAAARQGLQNLQGELAKRLEPARVDADSLKNDDEVLGALNKEVEFLDRFKNVVPTEVRRRHEAAAQNLEQRHISIYGEQHACDNAKVPTAKFKNGANGDYEARFTADDVDTRSAQTADGRGGHAIFVMNANGELFASTYQRAREFHHSSLAGGQPVAAAGEVVVENGRLVEISNQSGHYWPEIGYTHQALASLQNQGINLSGVKVKDVHLDNERTMP